MSNQVFTSATIGPVVLANHLVMAPMLRGRALGGVPNELMAEYYGQRATAGLIIAEGASPAANGQGYARMPGLYNQDQLAGWRQTTQSVHSQGGKIFVQLMHTGRIFHPFNLPTGAEGVGPSAIAAQGQIWTDQQQLQSHLVPRALTTAEVKAVVQEFGQAACNAREAGFDGVELHGANGYLVEQFLNPHSNQRTDAYGGSVANRARFLLETVHAISEAIGAERTSVRLSPYSTLNDQPNYPEIEETYVYLAKELQRMGLAYLHLINVSFGAEAMRMVQTMRQQYSGTLLLNGNFDRLESIEAVLASGQANLVAIGRPFIANPDLVHRLQEGLPLAVPNLATYGAPGPGGFAEGYTDYPAVPVRTV
jgi:N-ethylmaleimide reductase